MLKFGFQSSKYNNLNLEEELSFSQCSDIDFFDIFFDGFLPSDIASVELPSTVTVHAPYGFGKLLPQVQKEYIDFVNQKNVAVFTLNFVDLTLEVLDFVCQNIKTAIICIENNIPDCNEFSKQSYIEFMVSAKSLADQKGYKIYSAFDTGHAKVNGQEAIATVNLILSKGIEIHSLHLHDNDGHNDQHRPAGSIYNGINFEELLNNVSKANYDVYAVIEHWNNNYNALEYLRNLQK